jgi:hypothetical protein
VVSIFCVGGKRVGGRVTLKYETEEEEEEEIRHKVPLRNGRFRATRHWVSIINPECRGDYSLRML